MPGLLVTLEGAPSDEEIDGLVAAVRQLRLVACVEPCGVDVSAQLAASTARQELTERLWAVLWPRGSRP